MTGLLTKLTAICFFSLTCQLAYGLEVKGAGQFSIPPWFKDSFLDLSEDVKEATQNKKRLMIYFHQDGCPYCAELVNTNFSQKDIVDYTRKHFEPLEINMWGDREVVSMSGKTFTEKTFAQHLKVWFTPTVLFFNEKGNVVLRINGYYPPHQFMTALRYVAEKQESQSTFRDYYRKSIPVKSSGKLISESFYIKPPYNLEKLAAQKPLAVFFEQKQCPGCDALHNNIFRKPETLEQLKKYNVVQLDMWSDTPLVTPEGKTTTANNWARKLGITYAPSAVFYDQGKEVIRIEAFLKAFHVQSVMDYASSGAYKTQHSLQRFIQHRAEKLIEQGSEIDLWK